MISKKIYFLTILAASISGMIVANPDDIQKNIATLLEQSTKNASKVSEFAPLYPLLGTFSGAVGAGLFVKFVGQGSIDNGTLIVVMAGGGVLGYLAGESAAQNAENISKHNVAISNNQLATLKALLDHSNKK